MMRSAEEWAKEWLEGYDEDCEGYALEERNVAALLRAYARECVGVLRDKTDAMSKVGKELFDELTDVVAAIPAKPIDVKKVGDLWHRFGKVRAEYETALRALPGETP